MRKRTWPYPPDILPDLFDETVALFHRLTVEAEKIHGQGALSAALRGVLRGLWRHGPHTVPSMARMRPVSRQHIQGLVNRLREERLVEFAENPAHKRSQLVKLTPKGMLRTEEMAERESRLLLKLETDLSVHDIGRATETLRAVRRALESPKWKKQFEKKI